MAGPIITETGGETTARQAAAATLETTLGTLLANITSYLAAGSGDTRFARDAVYGYVEYKLKQLGMPTLTGGGFVPAPGKTLSQVTLNKEG